MYRALLTLTSAKLMGWARNPDRLVREAKMAILAVCPSCDEEVELKGRVRIGQRVTCPWCGAELEVFDVNPVELTWVDDEDWEEDDEDFDDDDLV